MKEKSKKQNAPLVISLIFLSLIIYYSLSIIPSYLYKIGLDVQLILIPKAYETISFANSTWLVLKKPLAYLIGVSFVFFIEAFIVGYKNSSFFRIINFISKSGKTDSFYIFLKISGLADIIFNLILLGFGFYLLKKLESLSLITISHLYNSYILELFLVTICTTFCHYWHHRIMHHPIFWELHKLHHSASEMNIITASREHPLVSATSGLLIIVPVLILGIRAEVLLFYKIFNSVWNMFLHSKVDLIPIWFRKFFITTKDHYIHHSINSKHFNKNFGDVFTIWDRVFGSYYNGDSTKDKIILGVEDKNYHKPLYFKDIILILRKWILSNFKRNYQ
jgi:sterol desaturase/sphingolipid hydroxylase (fatty acid hydroxylase superfamily)